MSEPYDDVENFNVDAEIDQRAEAEDLALSLGFSSVDEMFRVINERSDEDLPY